MLLLRWMVVVLSAVCAMTNAGAVEDTRILFRDADHGHGVSARLELTELPERVSPTTAALEAVLARATEQGAIRHHIGMEVRLPLIQASATRAQAEGYEPLLTVIEPGAGSRTWTLWLRPSSLESAPDRGKANLVHGRLIDPLTLAPVADATLRLASAGVETRSDLDGRFQLQADEAAARSAALYRDTLIVRAMDGRRVEQAIALAPGSDLHLIVGLEAIDDPPRHRHLSPGTDALQREPDRLYPGGRLALDDILSDEPPASIRVGYGNAGCSSNCCTQHCTHVCVFDTETYVRRGLNKEWIASWNTQSLRAGSIAYRSYGAWHAFNPVAGRPFDLCSSACCQVNGPGTSASTDLATGRTAGLMLVRNALTFRSEYSAENNCLLGTMSCANNDLSCGNGFAGSPAANWPCLADEVGLNRDCFGHGRGMSQWGTQRWSLAPHLRTWRWQTDHYYNAHGSGSGLRTATISRVLVLDAIRPRQRTVAAGQTLIIDYDARNLATETHEHVLLGASLRAPPAPFVNDPANDRKLLLPPGVALRSRQFVVPSGASPGRYDLYASLYLDVDDDDAITATDLAQALLIQNQVVRIVAPDDLIFYDGLQSSVLERVRLSESRHGGAM